MTAKIDPVRGILKDQPCCNLFSCPSPIQRLPRLEAALGGKVTLYIKRDDMLKPMFGNKIRYLEYVLGLYNQAKADCMIHAGGLSSNYMSQLAMICAEQGITIHLILGEKRPLVLFGNPLLQEMCGAKVYYQDDHDSPTNSRRKQHLAEELRAQGKNPFVIDYPLSNYTAYCGYMRCYLELCEQGGGTPGYDHIFLCSGWHSYLGLCLAADLMEHGQRITAFRPSYWKGSSLGKQFPDFNAFMREKIREFGEYLGLVLPTRAVDLREDFVGEGYAIPDRRGLEAIHLLAKTEGILLDPIYTGKAFAGLIDAVKRGTVKPGESVLFIHTGGIVNFFNYNMELTGFLNAKAPGDNRE